MSLIQTIGIVLAALGFASLSPSTNPTALDQVSAKAPASAPIMVGVERVSVPLAPEYRGSLRAIVTFTDQATIEEHCGVPPKGARRIACVDAIGGAIMYLPNPCDAEFQGEDYASVVCHEKGHSLGWLHEMPHFFSKAEQKD